MSRGFREIIISSPALSGALFFRHKTYKSAREQQFNPLLQDAFPEWLEDPRTDYYSPWRCPSTSNSFFASVWNSSDKMRIAFPRKEASWRRMFVVQPPAVTLDLETNLACDGGCTGKTQRFTFDEGLKMGLLYDLVYSYFARTSACSFRIMWRSNNRKLLMDGEIGIYQVWEPKLILNETLQCDVSACPEINNEFESQGHEAEQVDLILDWIKKL